MSAEFGSVLGRTLGGRYRINRLIGSGGMGAVYEATQLDRLERSVAVKVLFDVQPKAIARLRQEAMAAGSLQSPHVVTVLDFQHNPGEPPFLVLELLAGESLWTLLRREGMLDEARAIAIARQMLLALDAAHRAGIVHRDVKPSNVWLVRSSSSDVHVKLLDFGVAKVAEESGGIRTTTGALLGTPSYLAPEQLRGERGDARSDLHAVGIVLYEMLTGARPWKNTGPAAFLEILEQTPAPIRSILPTVSVGVSRTIEQVLAKDPSARYQTAIAMAAALAGDATDTLVDAPLPEPTAKRTRRRDEAPQVSRVLVFVVAVVGALFVGVGALAFVVWSTRTTAATSASALADAEVTPAIADAETEADAVPPPLASSLATSEASAVAPAKARKPTSNKCTCVHRGPVFVEALCMAPVVHCYCTAGPAWNDPRVCPTPYTTNDRGSQECANELVYSRPTARSRDRCSGWIWSYANNRNQESEGQLQCSYCSGHREYPGFQGQRCHGITVNGEWFDGKWECPR
jgi:hypothetical protein